MSWPTFIFGCLNFAQSFSHLVENLKPNSNWNLFGTEYTSKLPKYVYAKEKLRYIEKIKNQICKIAQIPLENVTLRLQEKDVIENHGNSYCAVLGISLQLLTSYQPSNLKVNGDTPVEKIQRERFRNFIEQLPQDPQELKNVIINLSQAEREELLELTEKFILDLDDAEMRFVISHEILGHVKANDSFTTGIATSLLGWGSFFAAEYINSLCSFSGSKYFWHSIFYTVSSIGLQSVIIRKQERNADQQALMVENNHVGGIKFFKKFLALNLLRKYQEQGNSTHFYQLLTDADGESFFNISYETIKERLLKCQNFK